MLISMEAFKGEIAVHVRNLYAEVFCVNCKAMFTLYADYTMTSSSAFKTDCGSMDRLVASQVRPCQSNLMLLSL